MSAVLVVVLLVVLVALLVLGVMGAAVALLVAWIRGLWQDLRGTPMVGSLTRGANVARPLVQYRDALRLAPPDATAQTLRIQRKSLALEQVKDHLASEDRYHVEETTRRYLPDTLNAYRLAVTGAGREQRSAAGALLMRQLAQLEDSVDNAARGAGETGMRALQANGQFLRDITDHPAGPDLQAPDGGGPAAPPPGTGPAASPPSTSPPQPPA